MAGREPPGCGGSMIGFVVGLVAATAIALQAEAGINFTPADPDIKVLDE